ncbi:MAG: SLC26A/SulP transporter family protein [Candidatus Promineofilum sp.]|nr:SLC26A/SulP transporter family protein [Promineifilum sp.]
MSANIRATLRAEQLVPILLVGFLSGVLQIALAASFAALIFSGETAAHLPRGIGLALFSATVSIVITSLLTSYPAIMSGNQSAPAAVVGVMAAGIAGLVADPDAQLATVLAAIALTTLITGLFLLGLGTFRLGGLVRFLPYPVAGGFLAGTGWLLVVGGISTMSGRTFSFADVGAFFEPHVLLLWLPGLALGALILAFSTRIRHSLFMPVMIIAIIAGFYLVAAVLGVSPSQLSDNGWLLGPFPAGRLWQPLSSAELAAVDWPALRPQLPNLVGTVIISAIALLLNATGIELAMNREIDLNREMRAAGAANLASGMGAGLVSYAQLSMSTLAGRLGAANRLTGLLAGALCGLTLWLGGSALGFVPTVVLGALLVYLGLSFLWEWVVQAYGRLPRIDYLIVLAILVIIAIAGFLPGIVVGIAATVTMFVVSYSRMSIVKHELSGATFKSRVTRNAEDRALLEAIGDQAYILQLQGFIFFGTANGLLEKVRVRVREKPTRYVVIDFRQVLGLDSTALLSFNKMRQLSRDRDFMLVFAGLSARLQRQFDHGDLVEEANVLRYAQDIDHAAEWCEDQICAVNAADLADRTLTDYLLKIVPSPAIERLLGYMERQEVAAGSYIIHQGDASAQLFFLESGQLTAQLELPNAAPVRLETMQGGRVVGELGFYLGTKRSASVVADRPSVLYRLSQSTLTRVEADDPEVAYAFHRIIIHLLGERVLHLVRAVDVLQS